MPRTIPERTLADPLPRSSSGDASQLLRLKKFLLMSAAVVLLFAWVFAGAYIVTDRQHSMEAARNQLRSFGIALNAHTEAIFADGLGTARAAANQLAAIGGIQSVDTQSALALLRAQLTGGEYVSALFVGTSARTLTASRAGYVYAANESPQWLREVFASAPMFFVGAPIPDPAKPAHLVIPIARRVMGQATSAVYAGAWFDIEALQKRYARVLPHGGAMGLLTESGGILARISSNTHVEQLPLPDAEDIAIYRRVVDVAQQQPTIIMGETPRDLEMMYAISRPEPGAPLIAVVGQSVRSILARWRSRTAAVLAMTGMFSAVLSVLTFMLHRYLNQLDEAQTALTRANETLEQRVEQRTIELLERNEELETFTAAVSHDLRSPLSAISGQAGLLGLALNHDSRQEVRDRLEGIHSGIRRAVEVIEGLLTLARVSRHDLKWERVSLSELVDQSIADIRAQDAARAVESRIQQGLVVIADPRLMKSLVDNLVSNAWKYSAAKQRVEIEFTCEYTADGAVYCIRDRGAGFDMAHVTHLFQPFRRLHTVREFPGTGVGLAIVARVARRYGGTVSARGQVGRGATFCFTLPRAQIANDVDSRCA